MWIDKQAAKGSNRRMAEKNLFLLAFFGGSVGIYMGTQRPIYHKTSKWTFRKGIPIILISQIILVFFYFYQKLI